LDARNPVLPLDAEVARLPALELAYSTPAADPIAIDIDGVDAVSVQLRDDGWIEVPLDDRKGAVVEVEATNPHGQAIHRRLQLYDATG
ncbi:MAG: hypothetical protein ACRDQT_10715, partial [Gaiellaceae bacterium]